ncbi:hypothetical protein Daus18300_013964 [Diaporthe australafricana]|uniref:AAA+ ATPase domain-containing protein n=1 Tax=Diaporthe australafricana TaxID=127596 RepID=A0ABR3VX28_9PEZI
MEEAPAVLPTTLISPPEVLNPEIKNQRDPTTNLPSKSPNDTLSHVVDKHEVSLKDTTEQQEIPTNSEEFQGAWIGYRVEYKDSRTGQVFYSNSSFAAEDIAISRVAKTPIFEHVTTYKTTDTSSQWASKPPRNESAHSEHEQAPHRSATAAASHKILIYSTAIINALQSVVIYYPSQSLSGDVLKIDKPYCILAHYYDQLVEFRQHVLSKSSEDLCVREKDAPEHLQLLIKFLDDAVMDELRAESERNKRGQYTYEHSWLHFDEFTGEVELTTHFIYEKETLDDEEAQRKIAYGKRYWDLIKKQCQYYKGKCREFPYNEVDGLVMTDMKAYYTQHFQRKPDFLEASDFRRRSSDCHCSACKRGTMTPRPTRNDWSSFYTTTVEEEPELFDYDFLLFPSEIPAFVFRTRTWETLHVKDFQTPQFGESMIDNLVTRDELRINTLKALAKSFARENIEGVRIEKDPWSADFVKGKGNGLIFLLHGKPGVGKTYTAECIAEYTKRPLMVLTSSDIGTDSQYIEMNLTKHFKTATSWGAVLLIDEADVFMERRGSADLARNSLVAGFLRALEFYEGILFLTTNRVGAFDDAFISRVHIKLYYPDFSEIERQRVWETFVKKLANERGDYMRVTIGAQEYIREGKQLKQLSWNGREIRNAFQTAVSLAEYENKQDGEGKIKLTEDHLKSVVELSKDFKDYIDNLHLADESKRALARKERLDSFGS